MEKTPNRCEQSEVFEQLSFLPPVTFCPTYPAPGTLSARALDELLARRHLNHAGFYEQTGSWRLAAYIRRLVELGWPLRSSSESSPSSHKRSRTVARYSLDFSLLPEGFQ